MEERDLKSDENVIGKGKPGPGRPPGTTNKVTGDLKKMILEALDNAGGAKYLEAQSKKSPGAFLGLLAKVLPMQVTGKDGNSITVKVITGVPSE